MEFKDIIEAYCKKNEIGVVFLDRTYSQDTLEHVIMNLITENDIGNPGILYLSTRKYLCYTWLEQFVILYNELSTNSVASETSNILKRYSKLISLCHAKQKWREIKGKV